MTTESLPVGIRPESIMRLWLVDSTSYSFERVYLRNGSWYMPRLKRTGELGVDLYFRQTDAMRAADANLARLAGVAGISMAQMAERLRNERLNGASAEVTGRVQVAPFASVGASLQEVTGGR